MARKTRRGLAWCCRRQVQQPVPSYTWHSHLPLTPPAPSFTQSLSTLPAPCPVAACPALQECSSSCTTEGVHVEVTPAYVGRQSEMDPTYEEEDGVAERRYYTYRVRVSNCG